ncbi:MAG: triphosphoribosyl-dephospho-CoA synthase [Candidatus Bathyarchaeota archaeon]|nr:triphosphoribosyl-dephospho-CoA synthase [Candidatus Bathyarchaeota archaeon]
MPAVDKAKHVSQCLQLAILLEVSTNKPGNVNFNVGFADTRSEHFLASAVAAAPAFEDATKRGIQISSKKLPLSKAGIGEIIKNCVTDIKAWQSGGNTLLGTVMLLVPIAVAAGMTNTKNDFLFNIDKLRQNLKIAVEATTAQDAVNLYEAVNIANPSGLNTLTELDVNNPQSKQQLIKEDISLFKVFQIGASYDDICYEWVNNYPVTFTQAYPYLLQTLKTKGDLNRAIVHTFLKVLAEHPDTFIARKVGKQKAQEISQDAQIALEQGGLETLAGRKAINDLDQKLRSSGNRLNPGTTADIIAATLSLCTLSGFRP